MSAMNAIVLQCIEEVNEKVSQIEEDLIQLEVKPGSRELVVEIFRALHTIKGATSFLGFTKLSLLAHAGEGLLVRLRDGVLIANSEIISALLSLMDAIREIMSQVASTGLENGADHSDLIRTLTRLQKAS